ERPPPQGGRLQIGIGGRLPSEQLAGFKSESPADFKSEWVADLLRNPHHDAEDALHSFQIAYLHPNFREVFRGNVMHATARARPLIGKAKQPTNLVEREVELSRPTDEAKAACIIRLIEPVTSRTAGRFRQKAGAFIVANGFDVHAGALRQNADRKDIGCRHGHHLHLISAQY
ncbi:MAG: hypothetical protein Q8M36_29090, partial [Reyranella sp.]